MIGTPEERRANENKTPFERDAVTNTQGRRCFPVNCTLEKPKNLTGPVKGSNPAKYSAEGIEARKKLGAVRP